MPLSPVVYSWWRRQRSLLYADFQKGEWRNKILTTPTLTQSNANNVYGITDYEGVPRGVLQNALPSSGLRSAYNLLHAAGVSSSHNLTASGWTATGGASYVTVTRDSNDLTPNGNQANLITFKQDHASAEVVSDAWSPSNLVGKVIGFCFRAKLETAGQTASFVVKSDGGTTLANLAPTLTSEWKWFSFVVTVPSGKTSVALRITRYNFVSEYAIRVGEIMWFDATGASTTAPPVYTDVETNYGNGVNGLRYFDTTNGNSVDGNGVVTEAAGTAIDTSDAGVDCWEAATNKCTNYNAAPDASLTNMTKTGDAAAVLSRVDDSAALATGKLTARCPSGYAFQLDNSAGTGNAFVIVTGSVTNTNPHSILAYARKVSGGSDPGIALSNQEGLTTFSNSGYALVKSENITPEATTRAWMIKVPAGTIARWVLNTLVEAKYVGVDIIVSGSAVSRTAPAFYTTTPSYITAGNPFVKVKKFKWLAAPANHAATFPWLLMLTDSTGSTDQLIVYYAQSVGRYKFVLRKDGVADVDANIWTTTPAAGAVTKIVVVYNGSSYNIYINGALRYSHSTSVKLDGGFDTDRFIRQASTNNAAIRVYEEYTQRGAWSAAKAIAEATV